LVIPKKYDLKSGWVIKANLIRRKEVTGSQNLGNIKIIIKEYIYFYN
jgi:hypothetical protein